MDLEIFFSWLNENKDWLFSGAGVVLVTAVAGFVWKSRQRQPTASSDTTIDQRVEHGSQNLQVGQASGGVHYHAGAQIDVNELAKTLLEARPREQDATGNRIDELIRGHEDTQQQIRQLTIAISALAEQRSEPDAPPGISDALEELSRGETDAAEALFAEVLKRKKAEGEASLKEAAAAARHIGALAFLHDTQKALSAYTEAVELDPDDPDGWNMLGHLRHRVGELNGAEEAYERVLARGNRISNKSFIGVAYGNLGNVYLTRGDLPKAEENYRESLAIQEELGHKEGMASVYGNLGIIYKTRGDLAKAEEYHLKSLAIEEELGRKEGMANAYGNLGNVYSRRGDLPKAEEYHLKSLAINEEVGRKESMAMDYANLGLVYKERRDLAQACEAWRTSRRLFKDIGIAPEVEKIQAIMDTAGCGQEQADKKDEEG